MPILSPEDHAFFDENGYVIVRNAVPQEQLDATVNAIWSFLEMDPNNPEDWYRPPLTPSGMLALYHHQALWDNRQHPRIHQAFSELLGTDKLWVSADRASMKPPSNPAHPEYDHKGFTHWDLDTTDLPKELRLQGVLCLTDTTSDMGGFQCVPGHHRILEDWIKTQPADRNPRVPDLTGLNVTPIPANAGDLVIWNMRLAHGNGHNVSQRPRLAQYITMTPAGSDETVRAKRVERWRDMTPTFVADPRDWERKHYGPATLTPLGRKLLGINTW